MVERSENDAENKIRAFCSANSGAVLFDSATRTLFDVFSAKSLALPKGEIESVEERLNQQTRQSYLRIELSDGRELALTQAGVAFVPRTRSSGPVSLPPAVCFRDFRTLLDRLKHELYGHVDRPPTRDTVQLVMMCIAILDGARAQGFDVSREERELESHLAELERRGTPKT